jgi:hypothetical protein
MKDLIIVKAVLIMVLTFAIGLSLNAQVMVTKVSQGSAQPPGEGFYYTLPKIVLRIDLVLEKTERTPGPLSTFAPDYLGIEDVIKASKESYRLLNATVSPSSVIDADQMYFVQLPAEKSKDERNIIFHLAENGALVSVNDEAGKSVMQPVENTDNTIYFIEGSNEFAYLAGYNKKKQRDTIVRKITIDTITINRFLFKTTWVEKSERERAEEAAQQIEKIREARFNLLTGYHEVNFGESIRYMDAQLAEMEQNYLELFMGKETTSVIAQTVFYTPQPGEKQSQLWRAPAGEAVSIELNPVNVLKGLSDAPASGPNKVYYRIPAQAMVKINFEAQTYFHSMFLINQLGAISTVPVSKSKLHFNPVTGNIMGAQKE